MTDTSVFDPAEFMTQTTEGVGSTVVTPIPAGTYLAIIANRDDSVVAKAWSKDGRSGGQLMVCFDIIDDDGSLKAKIDGRDPRHTQSYFLDLTTNPNGRTILDMGPGKNVHLNRLREAVDQNTGEAWNPMMLKGAGPIKIVLVVEPDKNDKEIPRNRLKALGKPNAKL